MTSSKLSRPLVHSNSGFEVEPSSRAAKRVRHNDRNQSSSIFQKTVFDTLPVIVFLDLDHCLIHYLTNLEYEQVSGSRRHAGWERVVRMENGHTVLIRSGVKQLILTLKMLDVKLEIVTQNLDGKAIVHALVEDEWQVWRGLAVTVVKSRAQKSKSILNTKRFHEFASRFSANQLKKACLILDDQENSWTVDDIDHIIEVNK